jgi:Domain of unknown function (DUF4184)
MPFTISHAAVVLPFSRLLARQRLLSATVIGAMVPDFGVFFPWRLGRVETHSILSLLTFCLPLGMMTYWIFQSLIKVPLTEVLPEGAYARWRAFASPADPRSARQWLLAAAGILGGAVTHLVWDGFTHEGARGVRMFPMLDDPILEIGRRHVAGVGLMQDLSSLIGLTVVLALVCYGLRRGHENRVPNRLISLAERRYWVFAYIATSVGLSIAFHVLARIGVPPLHSVIGRAYDIAVSALRGLAAALLGVSVILGVRLRALRYRSSGPER